MTLARKIDGRNPFNMWIVDKDVLESWRNKYRKGGGHGC